MFLGSLKEYLQCHQQDIFITLTFIFKKINNLTFQSDLEKSKGALKAERRAKQETQRAAKQAAAKAAKPQELTAKPNETPKTVKLVADAKATDKVS